MGDEMSAYTAGMIEGQNKNGGDCFGGGFGGGWIWPLILIALLFGGGLGFGGFGGGFGGGGGYVNGALTRAELYDSFATQNIDSAVRGVQQGICDSTYALTGSITNGFHGVDSAICNLGYNVQSGFNQLGHQISDCCCTTQRAIDGINYNMAKGLCDLGNTINMQTRDIIDNQNANYRGLMDFMVQEKLSNKDAQIAQLQNQLSQSQQNGVIRAAIDASTAEIIRRTGNDCPVPAYVVPNPNGCYGNPIGVGYGSGYQGGCGCGCAA